MVRFHPGPLKTPANPHFGQWPPAKHLPSDGAGARAEKGLHSLDGFRHWGRRSLRGPMGGEDWQLAVVHDVLAGYQAVWLVVPEACGKTTLIGGLALYHLDAVATAEVPVAAARVERANVLYREAEGFIVRTPG